MTESPEQILRTVETLILEIAGDEILLDGPLARETSFNGDLELESIEFVALAEKLQQHYGTGVDFVGWISKKELDEIIGLRVGDLVDFVAGTRE